MKKRLVISGFLICMFLFFSIVGLSNDVKYDFRKANWGMSKEQVKATESLDEVLLPLPLFVATKGYEPDTTYTIQIGTFSKEEDAQNLAKGINDKGYQSYVVKGETLYKVQVGEFKSYKKAQSFSNEMEKDKELRKIIDPPTRFDSLIYQDHIWGFDCNIYYWFLEDKFYQSSYWFYKSILNEDPRIEDYEELKRLLIKILWHIKFLKSMVVKTLIKFWKLILIDLIIYIST